MSREKGIQLLAIILCTFSLGVGVGLVSSFTESTSSQPRDLEQANSPIQQLAPVEAKETSAPSPSTKEFPRTLVGRIIKVVDGDTLTVLDDDNYPHKIRLEGIDAPEEGQDYSSKSRLAILAVLKEKGAQAKVLWSENDKYRRVLGHVFIEDDWLNLSQVENGWAWHYKKYSDDKTLADAEESARKAKRGLWADAADPMPPWEYRDLPRVTQTPRTASVGDSEPSTQLAYWLNTSSNVRHNPSCRWHGKTKRGRKCTADEGKACGICGG